MGGKSALQNEILGDLQKEFGTEPENAAETPLSSLAQLMGSNYLKLGPHSQKLIARLISAKMPAGFGLTNIRTFLSQEYSLGDGRIDGMLSAMLLYNDAKSRL